MSGNLFNLADKIIATDAIRIQDEIIEKLSGYVDPENIIKIGSIGKHNDDHYHGDIDLAIKCSSFSEMSDILYKCFPEEDYPRYLNTSKNLYIHSIEYKYISFTGAEKYVQVDFMLSTDIEYTKFRYYCPDYRKEETKYKVYARILLLKIILNNCDEYNYTLTPIGLLNKQTKAYIIDVKEILGMMFIEDASNDDIGTTEKLWEALHSDKFRHPDKLKKIERAFFVVAYSQPWEQLGVYPEDFKLTYWTPEELNEFLTPMNDINRMNLELVNRQKQ